MIEQLRVRHFEPEAYTLYSYAAVQVIGQAINAVRSFDPKRVAAQISSGIVFNTVIGDLDYNSKGDVNRIEYVVYIWKRDPSGLLTYSQVDEKKAPTSGR